MLGKKLSPLDNLKPEGGYKRFEVGELFDIHPTKSYGMTNIDLFATKGNTPVITNTSLNNGVSNRVALLPTERGGIITYSDTTTSDAIFYQPEDFIGYSHIQGLYPYHNNWTKRSLLYFVTAFRKAAAGLFDYGNKFNRRVASKILVSLPVDSSHQIDFNFMKNFIAELEAQRITELEAQRNAELDAYLRVAGLKDYALTKEEQQALDEYKNIEWYKYSFMDIFDKIKQGRRLKKEDQKKGDIPFVMAGITNTGVVNYVSNPVATFPKNSITIDIFGNVFYRDYSFGAGDDTGVYWNDYKKYTKSTMLFFATMMDLSLKGKYSYGKKLRSSQSKGLKMLLPVKDCVIDFKFIDNFISAIQKLVIKEVVQYADSKIAATKEVVGR